MSSSPRRARCSAAARTASAPNPIPSSAPSASAIRAPCRSSTARRRPRGQARPRPRLHGARALGLRAQELLLPRPSEGLPDQPVRPPPRRGRPPPAHRPRPGGAHPSPPPRGGRRQAAARGARRRRSPGLSLVDFNRCGVPLVEIVSEPDISTAGARRRTTSRPFTRSCSTPAPATATWRRGACAATPTSRCAGAARRLGTKTEVKNLNSFSNVARAIEHEIARQIALLEAGGRVVQETRSFDAD